MKPQEIRSYGDTMRSAFAIRDKVFGRIAVRERGLDERVKSPVALMNNTSRMHAEAVRITNDILSAPESDILGALSFSEDGRVSRVVNTPALGPLRIEQKVDGEDVSVSMFVARDKDQAIDFDDSDEIGVASTTLDSQGRTPHGMALAEEVLESFQALEQAIAEASGTQ